MSFLGTVFSEGDKPSFGRLASGVALLFACGWTTYLVAKNHALPALDGLTAFIVALYALNKAAETVRAFTGNGKP